MLCATIISEPFLFICDALNSIIHFIQKMLQLKCLFFELNRRYVENVNIHITRLNTY